MYNEAFVAALVLGVVALLLPVAWIAWWYVADVTEGASGYDRGRPRAV